jgi:hypothetical protein
MERREGADERRRQRQLAEIASLLELGHRERAGGLLVEHLARYTGDAAAAGRLLARYPEQSDHQPRDRHL